MKCRPILFSGEMIRALLAGTKTQTRRLLSDMHISITGEILKWPYGDVGDRLWVRETWADRNPLYIDADGDMHRASQLASMAVYRATDSDRQGITWRPSIHMPRWASRLTLEITGVRVERLQDISEADAIAEGVARDAEPCDHKRQSCADVGCLGQTHRSAYCALWDQLNAARAPWSSNPYVWALNFTRIPP